MWVAAGSGRRCRGLRSLSACARPSWEALLPVMRASVHPTVLSAATRGNPSPCLEAAIYLRPDIDFLESTFKTALWWLVAWRWGNSASSIVGWLSPHSPATSQLLPIKLPLCADTVG